MAAPPPLPTLSQQQRQHFRATRELRLSPWQQQAVMRRNEWFSEPGEAEYWVDGSRIVDYFGGCAWLRRSEAGGYVGQTYALGRVADSQTAELFAIRLSLTHFAEGRRSGEFSNPYLTIWSDSMDSIMAIFVCRERDAARMAWSGLYPPGQVDVLRDILSTLTELKDHAVTTRVVWRKRDAGAEIRKADELASTGSRFCVTVTHPVREIRALPQRRFATYASLSS